MPRTWLQTNIAHVIALLLALTVCYLAVSGVPEARAALAATFGVLAGSLFGSYQTMLIPGKNQ